MSTPQKLGVLVAIPIKGRKILNKSGAKQSPYVQLRLGDQKKRTKASLISSVEPEWDQEIRLDVYQGNLDMHVKMYDEAKDNEMLGVGTLRLHEVVNKGELDVWFTIKNKGSPAGEIYFELTFYAVAPPQAVGAPVPHVQIQHPAIRYTQPGYMPAGRSFPQTPPLPMYGNIPGPPVPFPGNTYQHQQPYSMPMQQLPHHPPQPPIANPNPYSIPNGGSTPKTNSAYGPGALNPLPFQPKTKYTPKSKTQPVNSGNNMPHLSNNNFAPQGNQPGPGWFSQPQPGMQQNHTMRMAVPSHINTSQVTGYGQNFNGQSNNHNMPMHNDRRASNSHYISPVTPPVQYNYSLGSFP
ncbi:hypothetical protein BGZ49_001387 [Haplosporangium sp. Z 27]|nr:hypothetical protein BGZ49_001387 [Haplosporangium sp. Z 27]